jgi:hypothetical protein
MQVDTLMKYLFNSLQSLESDHRDALCPVQRDRDQSFMGNEKVLQPLSREEFQLLGKNLVDHMNDNMNNNMNNFMKDVKAMLAPLVQQVPTTSPATALDPCTTCGHVVVPHLTTNHLGTLSLAPAISAQASNTGTSLSYSAPPPVPASAPLAQPQSPQSSRRWEARREAHRRRPPPVPGAVIPKLPRGPNAWRAAVKQWDDELKDWEDDKYKGNMGDVNGLNRRMRELIAKEYDKYVHPLINSFPY